MSYRGAGGFGGGRSSGGEDCATMMVESFRVGKIIGRGGCKIKELENDANVRIKVSREEDDQGMKSVEISGAPEDIDVAKGLIEECLAQNDYGNRRGGYGRGYGQNWGRDGGDGYRRGGGRGRGYGQQDAPSGDRETVYVESSDVGRIIGRGGVKIRDLEAESGCSIKVSRDADPSGKNSVDLTGSKESISRAKRLIEEAGIVIIEENNCDRGW